MIQADHQPYDKSSKWLIQHHGDSMLRLAKMGRIENWRPAQAEVVQPRQWPDGLIEAHLEGEPRDDLFLIDGIVHPNNYDEWERLVEALAEHCREQRFEVAAWEVCNEPDIGESGGTPHLFRSTEDYNSQLRRPP